MDEKEVQNMFIKVLCSSLNGTGTNLSSVTPEMVLPLYHLAKKHDLAHIVSDFVFDNGIKVPDEIENVLQQEKLMSVFRCEQIKYVLDEISDVFDKSGTAYIPLKGSVIRPYYPTESMRTSCDVDVLIRESDFESAVSCLESRGYVCSTRNYHDVSMYSPNKVHVELHFSIQENIESLDEVLKNAWQYAELSEGSRYEFRKEFFVFYFYAHMAYHFLTGGCGMRSLMDIRVMEHKMNISYLCAADMLKKAGICQFAAEMSNLAEYCFGDNVADDFYDTVLDYIVNGGVYGSKENKIAVSRFKSGSRLSYTFKRLFLPYKAMVISYPVLKKVPCLLPFCWVARWVKAISRKKTKKITSELSFANNMADSKIAKIRYICTRLGL